MVSRQAASAPRLLLLMKVITAGVMRAQPGWVLTASQTPAFAEPNRERIPTIRSLAPTKIGPPESPLQICDEASEVLMVVALTSVVRTTDLIITGVRDDP